METNDLLREYINDITKMCECEPRSMSDFNTIEPRTGFTVVVSKGRVSVSRVV